MMVALCDSPPGQLISLASQQQIIKEGNHAGNEQLIII